MGCRQEWREMTGGGILGRTMKSEKRGRQTGLSKVVDREW